MELLDACDRVDLFLFVLPRAWVHILLSWLGVLVPESVRRVGFPGVLVLLVVGSWSWVHVLDRVIDGLDSEGLLVAALENGYKSNSSTLSRSCL